MRGRLGVFSVLAVLLTGLAACSAPSRNPSNTPDVHDGTSAGIDASDAGSPTISDGSDDNGDTSDTLWTQSDGSFESSLEDVGSEADVASRPMARVTVSPERLVRGDNYSTVVTLDASGSTGGALRFQWTIPDGRLEPGSTLNDPVVRVRFPGTADHHWSLRVSNTTGEDAIAGVVRVNRIPVANAGSGATITLGGMVVLDGSGSIDPDGDRLSYRWTIVRRPVGSTATLMSDTAAMTIFRPDVVGTYEMQLVVNDGLQDSAPSSVTVVATSSDLDPPVVTLTITPAAGAPGTVFRVCVNAMDGGVIASRELRIDGTMVTVDGLGCGTYTGTVVGRHEVNGIARDDSGNVGTATGALYVRSSADNGPPTVSVTAPVDGAIISGPTDITGTVTDSDLASYWIEAAPVGSSDYTVFARGTMSVTNGRLGSILPGAFRPGAYRYRLCADDAWGHRACTPLRSMDIGPWGPRPGIVRIGFVDAQFDLFGLPIAVRRIYDSRFPSLGDFGYGWTMDIDGGGTFTQLNDPSTGWIETGCSRFPFRPAFTEVQVHRWTVLLGSRVYRFRQTLRPGACISGGAEVDVTFTPEAGTTGTLTPTIASTGLLFLRGSNTIVDGDLNPWSPRDYRLVLPDGITYELTVGRGVTAITDASGNRITLSPEGISHSGGVGVRFVRDAQGRVTELSLPDGRRRGYRYNTAGDLVITTDFAGVETRYRYDSQHLLTQIIDARGNIPGTLEYDSEGRLIAIIDASGRRVTLRHESGNRSVITDRLGNTTVLTYDDRGNIVSRIDGLGNETRWTYDANGRPLTRTDPLGNVTRYEWDANGRQTAVIDPLGNRWTVTYDAAGNVTSRTDPTGATERYEYSPSGLLTAVVNPLGGRTVLGYTPRGALASITDPVGGTVTLATDASGRLTGYTDPAGRNVSLVTRDDGRIVRETFRFNGTDYSYENLFDMSGRIVGQRLPNGAMTQVRYNRQNLVDGVTDARGLVQRLTYDTNGQPSVFQHFDGTSLVLGRDAESRVTGFTLSDGRTFRRTLDPLGRPTSVTLPSGITLASTYDAAGRLVSFTSDRGTFRMTYDAAGRVTSSTSPWGAITRYEYDRAGRRTATIDPLGNRTEIIYDAAGNVRQVRHPGGATSTIERDLAGQIVAITDERGAVTRFVRNRASEITSVTDPSGEVTRYTYDDIGMLASATLPSGATWVFLNSPMGDRLARRFPWGGEETRTYDAAGRITRSTDATMVTVNYEYDTRGRLTARIPPTASEVERVTYTPSGQLATASGPWGVTSYSYDASGRLRSVIYSGGMSIEYEYDSNGRRTAVRTPGGTTRYEYGSDGLLVAVNDSVAGRTSYRYDALGRVSEITLPDGSTTTYSRDARGFVTRERTVSRTGTVIRDVSYTRDAAGNPTSITENGGRTVAFTFDAAGRVSREVRTGPDSATVDYGYDRDASLVRIGSRTFTLNQLRLMNDGVFTYSYDAAGRVIVRTGAGRTENFRYDSFGRLIEVTRTGATPARVQLGYDQNGLLHRVVVDGAGRTLLWDTHAPIPQLIEERSDDGRMSVRYVHGHGPVAVVLDGTARAIHRDAQGSVRLLTTMDGTEVARYAYSAYGESTLGAADVATRLRYKSEYYLPELGLYFLRTRFYDPSTGRFLTPDRDRHDPEIPSTFHPYQYAGGNPVQHSDPTGEFSLGQMVAAVNIMSTLASIALPMFPSAIELVARGLGLPEDIFDFTPNGWNFTVTPDFNFERTSLGLSVDLYGGVDAEAGLAGMIVISLVWGLDIIASNSDFFESPFSYGPISEDALTPEELSRAKVMVSFNGNMATALIQAVARKNNRGPRMGLLRYLRNAVSISWEPVSLNASGLPETSLMKISTGVSFAPSNLWKERPNAIYALLRYFKNGKAAPVRFGGSISIQVQIPLVWFYGNEHDGIGLGGIWDTWL